MIERIQKIISAAGITSRRAAEELIAEGRVRVNGAVVTELGAKADAEKDHIKVDGKLINPKQPKTYIMLNKPAGFVTTMSDPEGRPTVQDLLKGIKVRVYPVGRLDYNTEGLLLLTNDGDFAHLITHPKHEFPKSYLAKIKGVLEDSALQALEQGVFLKDGKTAPAKVRKIRKEEANSWVEMTIHEGRKRQVRRMFDHVGRSVIRLKRVRTGSLSLGDLHEGAYRHLTSDEVRALRETAEKTDDKGQTVRVYKPAVKQKPAQGAREEGRLGTSTPRGVFTHKTEAGRTRQDYGTPRFAGVARQQGRPFGKPATGGGRFRPGARVMQETTDGRRRNQGTRLPAGKPYAPREGQSPARPMATGPGSLSRRKPAVGRQRTEDRRRPGQGGRTGTAARTATSKPEAGRKPGQSSWSRNRSAEPRSGKPAHRTWNDRGKK